MSKKIFCAMILALSSMQAMADDDNQIYIDIQGDFRSMSRVIMQRLSPFSTGAKTSMLKGGNYFPVSDLGNGSGVVLLMDGVSQLGPTSQGHLAGSGGYSAILLYQCALKDFSPRFHIKSGTGASVEIGNYADSIGGQIADHVVRVAQQILTEQKPAIAFAKSRCQELNQLELLQPSNSNIRASTDKMLTREKSNSIQSASQTKSSGEAPVALKEESVKPEWSKGQKKGDKCSTKLPCGPALECVSGICSPNW